MGLLGLEITEVLISNYLPYAKGTIIGRAIPSIDGLKPSQRRILYTMYKMGLLKGNKSKSSNIKGQSMKLHPHGDDAIYETMVRLSSGYEALNYPYLESKGSFGKVYSKDLKYAAPRYTEAKLTEICKELFEGIDENAVDLIPNYDNTEVEPVLLPVKFPSILVNTSAGIAVGMSSNIPPFPLREVCEATIGIIEGKVKDIRELMEILGAPDFSTRGYIHGDQVGYEALGKTGRGTVELSSSVELYKDCIIVKEIPYGATVETIIEDIIDAMKNGDLKEVADVKNGTDLNGLGIVIELKRGYNAVKVLRKISRMTKMRMRVSFITRVIIDGRPREIGLYELLEEWIKFRVENIRRIYEFRLNKKINTEHLLSAWEKIDRSIKEVAIMIASNKEDKAREILSNKYGLEEEQVQYILDMRIREFTQDRLIRKLTELESTRRDINVLRKIVTNDDEKKKIIVSELKTIKNKYGTDRRTTMAGVITDKKIEVEEEQIANVNVSVIVTRNGYIKRMVTLADEERLKLYEDDQIEYRVNCSNRDTLIVLAYDGTGYKIPVHTIDTGKGLPRDNIVNIIPNLKIGDIMYITNAGDYSGSINIVGYHGRGVKLQLSKLSGPRSKYKNLYEKSDRSSLWCIKDDKFFVITRKRRAAYVDLTLMNKFGNRAAFKAARILPDDEIFGLQPLNKVPDKDIIDLEKYSKGYCVKIRDSLW